MKKKVTLTLDDDIMSAMQQKGLGVSFWANRLLRYLLNNTTAVMKETQPVGQNDKED